jgi:hypothetical protein
VHEFLGPHMHAALMKFYRGRQPAPSLAASDGTPGGCGRE